MRSEACFLHPLGGHDEIETSRKARSVCAKKVLIAVGQHGQPAPHRPQSRQHGSTSSNTGLMNSCMNPQ
jgi:hypothetical protein